MMGTMYYGPDVLNMAESQWWGFDLRLSTKLQGSRLNEVNTSCVTFKKHH